MAAITPATLQAFGRLLKDGYPLNAAIGMTANAIAEAGPEGYAAVNKTGGDSGLFQWAGPRKQTLFARAAASGQPWQHPDVQHAFLNEEVSNDSALRKALFSAQDPGTAAALFTKMFERPADTEGQASYRAGLARAIAPALTAMAGMVISRANAAEPGGMAAAQGNEADEPWNLPWAVPGEGQKSGAAPQDMTIQPISDTGDQQPWDMNWEPMPSAPIGEAPLGGSGGRASGMPNPESTGPDTGDMAQSAIKQGLQGLGMGDSGANSLARDLMAMPEAMSGMAELSMGGPMVQGLGQARGWINQLMGRFRPGGSIGPTAYTGTAEQLGMSPRAVSLQAPEPPAGLITGRVGLQPPGMGSNKPLGPISELGGARWRDPTSGKFVVRPAD